MEFVSWDDDIQNCMEIHKIPWFQTTNQIKMYNYHIWRDEHPSFSYMFQR